MIQDLDHLFDKFRVGLGGRVEIEDSALAALVDVADGLAHVGVRVFARDRARRA